MIFQDPYSSLNPRKTVGSIIAEPFAIHGLEHGRGRAQARVQELMEHGRPEPRALQPLPARVLRRPAPAHRRRARARAEAEADRRRRAGVGARRLDPGADPQPAARAAARARPDAGLHRARPLGRAPHVRPRRRDVPRQGRRARRRPTRSTHIRATRTPARCCRAVPVADPQLRASAERQILARRRAESPTNPPPACRFHTRCPKFVAGHCDVEEPLLKPDPVHVSAHPGHLAACHYPLGGDEPAAQAATARPAP